MTHRIVIVGGGAGGLELATRLGRGLGRRGLAQVTLVDANLTHLWKPLLHEVAAGSLDSSEDELNYIAQARWNHFEFQLGRMCGLDRANRKLKLAPAFDDDGRTELVPARTIAYDTLVIAVGGVTNDFGTRGAAEHCLFLDTARQAEGFHRRLLGHYLTAHARGNDDAQVGVAIVGGGATGVELAAELRNAASQLAAYGLGDIRPENMRITLLEAGERILPALPARVAQPALQTLQELGVDIRTGCAVEEVDADGLQLADGTRIIASLKVWAAGVRAPDILGGLDGLESNRSHQLAVRQTLQTTRDDDVFAMGDCAACPMPGDSGRTVPPRAQAAHQQATMLARSMARRLQGRPLPEFRYRDYGSLVSLSRFSAVGNLMGNLTGDIRLEGRLARLFYMSLYRQHQRVLHGTLRTALIVIGDRLGRGTTPRLKMH